VVRNAAKISGKEPVSCDLFGSFGKIMTKMAKLTEAVEHPG